MLGGSPISWRRKKQIIVSRSSAKLEYRSIAFVTSELIWLRSFLASLGIFFPPMRLLCDSQAALYIVRNLVLPERTKHNDIDRHFVREKLEVEILTLAHIGTKQQPMDIFTESLGKRQFQFLQGKLGVLDLHVPT